MHIGTYMKDMYSYASDPYAIWRFVPAKEEEGAYYIQSMGTGQYLGAYRGLGADLAPQMSHTPGIYISTEATAASECAKPMLMILSITLKPMDQDSLCSITLQTATISSRGDLKKWEKTKSYSSISSQATVFLL